MQYVKIKAINHLLLDLLQLGLADKLSILSSLTFDAYLEINVQPEIVDSCWTHFIADYKKRYAEKNQPKETT
jgi:hypothetical protein